MITPLLKYKAIIGSLLIAIMSIGIIGPETFYILLMWLLTETIFTIIKLITGTASIFIWLLTGLFLMIITSIEWILSYLIYPLGIFILSISILIGLLFIPLTALIIAGIFSCPAEESFKPWLDSMILNIINMENRTIKSDNMSDINNGYKYWYKKIFMSMINSGWNYISKLYISKMMIMSIKPHFYHCGAFRLVICDINDNKNKNKGMIFIGAFNTWFPIKEI
jgi:hypothetical protein